MEEVVLVTYVSAIRSFSVRNVPVLRVILVDVLELLDPIRPSSGDHEDHHASIFFRRILRNELQPVFSIRIQTQKRVYAILFLRRQLLVGNVSYRHMAEI